MPAQRERALDRKRFERLRTRLFKKKKKKKNATGERTIKSFLQSPRGKTFLRGFKSSLQRKKKKLQTEKRKLEEELAQLSKRQGALEVSRNLQDSAKRISADLIQHQIKIYVVERNFALVKGNLPATMSYEMLANGLIGSLKEKDLLRFLPKRKSK